MDFYLKFHLRTTINKTNIKTILKHITYCKPGKTVYLLTSCNVELNDLYVDVVSSTSSLRKLAFEVSLILGGRVPRRRVNSVRYPCFLFTTPLLDYLDA